MITIVMKWGFILVLISVGIIALTKPKYKDQIIKVLKPHVKQLVLITLIFILVLLISLNGT